MVDFCMLNKDPSLGTLQKSYQEILTGTYLSR
jgi:hypothetical protein